VVAGVARERGKARETKVVAARFFFFSFFHRRRPKATALRLSFSLIDFPSSGSFFLLFLHDMVTAMAFHTACPLTG